MGAGIRALPQKDVSSSVQYNLLEVGEIPIYLCGLKLFLLGQGPPSPESPTLGTPPRARSKLGVMQRGFQQVAM